MKFKTTQKAINAGYYNRICIPYCELQTLLDYETPRAYTAGAYGWNADIYEISNNTAIITGYRPWGNVRPDYETLKRYEKAARDIAYKMSYEERKTELKKLLREFVAEVTT